MSGPRPWNPPDLRAAAAEAGADIDRCLALARAVGPEIPFPGSGDTLSRWELLAAAAAGDLTAARVLEPHVDALAIVHEAGVAASPGVWGVFAAEAPDTHLAARWNGVEWRLRGVKPWCSLAGRLDRALITAHADRGRLLLSVDLHSPGVRTRPSRWVARGLHTVETGPVEFDDVPAEAVGDVDWYLHRPGFGWGAMGVAACWTGGATALVETLASALADHPADPVRAVNLGAADAARFAARCSLHTAAAEVDAGRAVGAAGVLLAARVRAVVHGAAEHIARHVGHALGPTPLAFDEVHARRVADLELYLRQDHGERDLSALGMRAIKGAVRP